MASAGELSPAYEQLSVGTVKPRGWMLEQLKADLKDGITGHYDTYHANVSGELFAKQERIPGTRTPSSRGKNERDWVAGEHEGYWHDGLVRSAILANSQGDIDRVRTWVKHILDRYEETGYIGIYAPEARFPDKGDDGELWTQSRAMEALLAWYEFSGDQKVLEAVAGTVRKTINHYREKGTYFNRPGVKGGGNHGVGYMDTLEWLWRLTGDPFFSASAVWLYEDYDRSKNKDLQVNSLLDLDLPWQNHAPHTAESLHMPGIAAFFSGNKNFRQASVNVLPKLLRHTNPGGGFIAGKRELIGGVIGGGDEGNEYCSMTEAIISLGRLFQYEPNPAFGDWMENCALNAAQGARFHPANTGTIYLSRDNRLRADDLKPHGGRETFSAAHTAAACCTLNASRLLPSYIANMWYRSDTKRELFANLYGASELSTEIDGIPLRIVQETDFPFSDRIMFRMEPERPVAFDLVLRPPRNSGAVDVRGAGADVSKMGQCIRVSKLWKSGDILEVDFDFQAKRCLQQDGKQAFYQWGPLVFALPIKAEIEVARTIEKDGKPTKFYDFFVRPVDPERWTTLDNPDSTFAATAQPGDFLHPWSAPPVSLKGSLRQLDGTPFEVALVPMGSTALRRTTFPLTGDEALEANEKHK